MKHIAVKFYRLLDRRERKKILSVFFISTISSLVELLSVSLIVPLVYSITNIEKVRSNFFMKYLIQNFNSLKEENIILVFTIFFSLIIIISGLIRVFLLYYEAKVSFEAGSALSIRGFKKFIFLDFPFFLKTSQSDILVTMTSRVNTLILKGIYNFSKLISSLISTVILLIGIFIIAPYSIYPIFIALISMYLLLDYASKSKIIENGSAVNSLNNKMTNIIIDSWHGFRQIILDSLHSYFLAEFKNTEKTLRKKLAEIQILSLRPRIIIETFAFLLLSLFVLYLSRKNGLNELAAIAFLAVALQKIIPNIQNIFQSINGIRASESQFTSVLSLMESSQREINYKIARQRKFISFEIKNISFNYPNNPSILKDVNLKILRRDWILISGKSGIGKSSLLDILMGFYTLPKGVMLFNKAIISSKNYSLWQSVITYVPQYVHIYSTTFLENIILDSTFDSRNFFETCLKVSGLQNFSKKLPLGLYTKIGDGGVQLSGGEKQRLAIARALYRKKQVIFLDESTSAIDSDSEKEIFSNIKFYFPEITLILIAHHSSSSASFNKHFVFKNLTLVKKLNKPGKI